MTKGLLIVNTGNGKGKTTAALGLIFRALGRGHKVCLIQFLQGSWQSGELAALERFKDLLDVHVLRKGFTWTSTKDVPTEAGRAAWEFAKETLGSGKYQLIVLDELTYLMVYGMVSEEELIGCLAHRPEGLHVVVTGRDAPPSLMNIADLVTEMREVKHPCQSGAQAPKGIEF